MTVTATPTNRKPIAENSQATARLNPVSHIVRIVVVRTLWFAAARVKAMVVRSEPWSDGQVRERLRPS